MDENDGRIISNFVTQALNDQPMTVYGDGSQTRSFCYVDDMVEGLIRLMEDRVYCRRLAPSVLLCHAFALLPIKLSIPPNILFTRFAVTFSKDSVPTAKADQCAFRSSALVISMAILAIWNCCLTSGIYQIHTLCPT